MLAEQVNVFHHGDEGHFSWSEQRNVFHTGDEGHFVLVAQIFVLHHGDEGHFVSCKVLSFIMGMKDICAS